MTTVKSALVIGGGVAGPVVAMALLKAGISATVYEAHSRAADGLGVTLTLAPNGIEALKIVAAEAPVLAIGLPLRSMSVNDGAGKKIGEFPSLADQPPMLGLRRDELCRALQETAQQKGIRTEYGKRLVDVVEHPDGVTAKFADGSTAKAGVLIGADGIHSRVRTLIDADAPEPEVSPVLNFGGTADIPGPGRPDVVHFVFGRRAFFGYWAQPDGTTAWFANVPDRRHLTFTSANQISSGQWMRELTEIFADDVPARDLIAHTRAEELCAIGSIESMPSLPHWHRGRMVLVGDAAHAPSPSSGQGASIAVESAIQLARCLRDIPDPSQAFATYVDLRRSRVERIIKRGARTTNSKAVGPIGKAMMKMVMPLALRTFLNPEKTLAPEQRYRINWDSPVVPTPRLPIHS